jgi:ubiquinone biosynthesis protein
MPANKPEYKLPLSRLFKIRRAIKKYGLVELLNQLNLSPKAKFIIRLFFGSAKSNYSQSRGERIRLSLEDLGPVFVKFGQALSTRPDLLPPDIAEELAKLQDQVPPFSSEQALELVKTELPKPFDEVYQDFSETPLASASVAQVHACTLKDGTKAITKVVRPGIRDIIVEDLAVLYKLAQLAHDHWEQGPRMRPIEIIEEFDRTIMGELDMRVEAANGERMRQNFIDSDLIYVPEIYHDLVSEKVLVMERIFGTSIRDIEALKAKGIDMKKLAYDGVETFFKQAFEDNYFHADMHPGNIFVDDNGQYQALDFGIMGSLTDEDKNYLAENFIAFFNRDYRGVAAAHIRAGWVPAKTKLDEFEYAIQTVCEPIFAKKISEISFGNFLLELFQTARKFEMPIQPQLVLLQKTLLNIEGLGRQLYADLDLWETAKPFLEKWMSEQIGPKAMLKNIKKELPVWQQVLPEAPRMLRDANSNSQRVLQYLEQQQTQMNQLETDIAHLVKAQQRSHKYNLSLVAGISVFALSYFCNDSHTLESGLGYAVIASVCSFLLLSWQPFKKK